MYKLTTIILLALCLAGCQGVTQAVANHLNQYERSYSAAYVGKDGVQFRAGVTLRPLEGLSKDVKTDPST